MHPDGCGKRDGKQGLRMHRPYGALCVDHVDHARHRAATSRFPSFSVCLLCPNACSPGQRHAHS